MIMDKYSFVEFDDVEGAKVAGSKVVDRRSLDLQIQLRYVATTRDPTKDYLLVIKEGTADDTWDNLRPEWVPSFKASHTDIFSHYGTTPLHNGWLLKTNTVKNVNYIQVSERMKNHLAKLEGCIFILVVTKEPHRLFMTKDMAYALAQAPYKNVRLDVYDIFDTQPVVPLYACIQHHLVENEKTRVMFEMLAFKLGEKHYNTPDMYSIHATVKTALQKCVIACRSTLNDMYVSSHWSEIMPLLADAVKCCVLRDIMKASMERKYIQERASDINDMDINRSLEMIRQLLHPPKKRPRTLIP